VTPEFGLWTDLQARRLTPKEIADARNWARREILRMDLDERRKDHRISTIRRHVEALGGEIEIVARLKGREIRLKGV